MRKTIYECDRCHFKSEETDSMVTPPHKWVEVSLTYRRSLSEEEEEDFGCWVREHDVLLCERCQDGVRNNLHEILPELTARKAPG